jgi:uncharacterized protein (TIGR01319 family)
MTSIVDAESLLVIDVGSVSTRAILFDVVDERYRFVASGVAPSTAAAPYRNVSEGVRLALDRLQQVTGRTLVGADEQLIMPSQADGSGVDRFAATLSAGEPIKVVAIGLLEDVSLESARRLAATTYARVLHSFSLNDKRRVDQRLNTLIRVRPDLIVAAGGTEGGASQSVLKLLEAVGLAGYLLPPDYRPEVLFAGNSSLKDDLESSLGGLANLHFAPNLHPTLDVEQLDAAQTQMSGMTTIIRSKNMPGVAELNHWAGGGLLSTAAAYGRIIRFQTKLHERRKRTLGVDIGASATTIAAAYDACLSLNVFPQYGLGAGLLEGMDDAARKAVHRWLPFDLADADLLDYIHNKAIYPSSVPATAEEMAIETALARVQLANALKAAARSFPPELVPPAEGLLPIFEPIFVSGSVATNAANLAQSALLMLDALQPTGITTLILDQHHIVSALGAAAAVNPTMVVQVLESNSLLHMGTVISPVARVRSGTPVLKLKITYDSGHEASLEVKQGSLEVLPLPAGQGAQLRLQPLHRADIGWSPGRGGGVNVMGGALGLIIDARGRPVTMPEDAARRQELMKKWLWNLGGQ